MPFPGFAERVQEVRDRVAAAVKRGGHGQAVEIVAVTKTHPAEAVEVAWEAGLRNVGENKVQEALDKMPLVKAPVDWHLIGHLQRNKVKHLSRFAVLHSLDSIRLAEAVNADGAASKRRHVVLVQVNTSGEESKGGFTPEQLGRDVERLASFPWLSVQGVMTMAPLEAGEGVLRTTFAGAREAREVLRRAGLAATELSMGMSNDYELAVEEGATMVRLGTTLFGARA
jgi:pyridoxal phosphate enzyme (YggS family)